MSNFSEIGNPSEEGREEDQKKSRGGPANRKHRKPTGQERSNEFRLLNEHVDDYGDDSGESIEDAQDVYQLMSILEKDRLLNNSEYGADTDDVLRILRDMAQKIDEKDFISCYKYLEAIPKDGNTQNIYFVVKKILDAETNSELMSFLEEESINVEDMKSSEELSQGDLHDTDEKNNTIQRIESIDSNEYISIDSAKDIRHLAEILENNRRLNNPGYGADTDDVLRILRDMAQKIDEKDFISCYEYLKAIPNSGDTSNIYTTAKKILDIASDEYLNPLITESVKNAKGLGVVSESIPENIIGDAQERLEEKWNESETIERLRTAGDLIELSNVFDDLRFPYPVQGSGVKEYDRIFFLGDGVADKGLIGKISDFIQLIPKKNMSIDDGRNYLQTFFLSQVSRKEPYFLRNIFEKCVDAELRKGTVVDQGDFSSGEKLDEKNGRSQADETEVVLEGEFIPNEKADVKSKISLYEESGENVLDGEIVVDEGNEKNVDVTLSQESRENEASLEELRNRVGTLKLEADNARAEYFRVKRQEEAMWQKLKKYFRFKNENSSVHDNLKNSKENWARKLTEYKNAKLELVKREVKDKDLKGREVGAVMAETIRELDLRGSIENYNAWKDASWGNKKDSWVSRSLGRAKDWGDQYRNLNWKKRLAFSAAIFSISLIGGVGAWAGAILLGATGSALIRLLSAYGVSRTSYEYFEKEANDAKLLFHDNALEEVKKGDDLKFLEEQTKRYAEKIQKDFEQMIVASNRRAKASVALGALFLATPTLLSYGSSFVDEMPKFIEQVKIISGMEDFRDATVSVAETPVTLNGGSASVADATSVPETPSEVPPEKGMNAVPNPMEATKDLAQTVSIESGKSFERVLIDTLTEQGISKEDAGGIAHRAILDFAEKVDKPLDIFNRIWPDAQIRFEFDPTHPDTIKVLGVTRESGGDILGSLSESAPVTDPALLHSKPFDITVPSESNQLSVASSLPIVEEGHPAVREALMGTVPTSSLPIVEEGNPVVHEGSTDSFLYTTPATLAGLAGARSIVDRKNTVELDVSKVKKDVASENDVRVEKQEKNTKEISQQFTSALEKMSHVFSSKADSGRYSDLDKQFRTLTSLQKYYGAFDREHAPDAIFGEVRDLVTSVIFGVEKASDVSERFLSQDFANFARTMNIGESIAPTKRDVVDGCLLFVALFKETGDLPKDLLKGNIGDVVRKISDRILSGGSLKKLRQS